MHPHNYAGLAFVCAAVFIFAFIAVIEYVYVARTLQKAAQERRQQLVRFWQGERDHLTAEPHEPAEPQARQS